MKGAMEYLYNDNTIKDKAPKLEEFMKEAIKFLEQDMIEKSVEMIKGATLYLESDDEAKDEKSGKRVKYLENDKVAAGVNKVRLVDDFLKEALQYLDAEQEVKAKEIIQGIRLYVSQCDEIEDKAASVEQAKEIVQATVMYVAQDDTMKDKAATSMEIMDGVLTFLQQDQMDKAKEMIQDKLVKDVKDKAKTKTKRVKYLENNKVAAGVNKGRLVDDFLEEALTYLDSDQAAKAKEIIQGIRLYVSQCDEIKDKAAAVEEMIQGALAFIEQDSLDEAEEVIHGAMTYLDNDDDVKQLSKADHAKGVKYLEQDKAERGIEKALFVHEVLKALSYIDKKQVEQAKEIVQAVVMYVVQDDTMKDKATTSMDMMDGALTFLQQDQMDKAKEMIQGAMTYLKGDEYVKEADKLLRGMDVKEQDKLVKGVKEKAEAKAKSQIS
ncbi:hypothetical protein FF2_018235 [Malus domestica]